MKNRNCTEIALESVISFRLELHILFFTSIMFTGKHIDSSLYCYSFSENNFFSDVRPRLFSGPVPGGSNDGYETVFGTVSDPATGCLREREHSINPKWNQSEGQGQAENGNFARECGQVKMMKDRELFSLAPTRNPPPPQLKTLFLVLLCNQNFLTDLGNRTGYFRDTASS